ncbi:Glucan endo-1,3-beta-glucosidase [Thalictrum thalictroides]|uniref:Glucan endo-1,3-beta-glucosidase n=1 Tax=Thalictrum thalictroides TaxID=46969 RepID=A0A7J6W0G8_THATH|nr:Glucan endo-1,3-beta-glucosidase [Thalictrum thalictroides]
MNATKTEKEKALPRNEDEPLPKAGVDEAPKDGTELPNAGLDEAPNVGVEDCVTPNRPLEVPPNIEPLVCEPKGAVLPKGVPNPALQGLASDPSAATRWVQTNVRNYFPNVRIKYIVVGNEISPLSNQQYVSLVLPAMQNIYNAIVAAGLQGQIRVSTAIDTRVVENSFPPSRGSFRGDVRSYLDPIIGFLVGNNRTPLLVNVYPYFAIVDNLSLLLYALFTNPGPEFTDSGNNLVYHNLFDAILDSVYGALEKADGSGLEIVVSESGWPSAANKEATVANARTYNKNLINHVRRLMTWEEIDGFFPCHQSSLIQNRKNDCR